MVPDEWRLAGLGDVCQPKSGLQTGPFGSQLHASDYVEDGIPVVMPKDMINGRISTSTIARISPQKATEVEKHKLKLDDILFSRRGDLGRFAVAKPENVGWICGTGCMRARLEDGVSPDFIFCQLSTHNSVRWLESNAVGQTMPNLNTEILGELPLRLPPLPEQRKIAAILSTWDRAIELTEKLIAAKQKRKQALMQQLFSRKGKLNQHGSLKSVKLSTVLQRVNDPIEVDPTTEYREIGIRSHGKGIFHKDAVVGKSLGDKRVYRVHPDCFVFNVVFAWEQAIAKTTSNEVGMIASHRFPMYQPVTDRIDLDFLLYFFKTTEGKNLLGLASPGGAGRNRTLSQTGFLNTLIPLPTLKQQRAMTAVLCAIDTDLDLQISRRNSLKRQKKGLMQQLLTGKIRVNVDSRMVEG